MERIDLFNNLIVLAASDGKFTEEEIAFLAVRAENWGIAEEEVAAALTAAGSADAEIMVPESHKERVELLREMIYLMAVDGELAEIEKRLCATASVAMGFAVEEFEQIIDSLL